jgi:hypothetical protein
MKSKVLYRLELIFGGVLLSYSTTLLAGVDNGGLTPQEIAQRSLNTYAALSSYSDTGKTVNSVVGGRTTTTTFNIRLQRPNLFRVVWTQTSESCTTNGSWWSAVDTNFGGDESYFFSGEAGQPTNAQSETIWIPLALDIVGKASEGATIIPEVFFRWEVMGEMMTDLASNHLSYSSLEPNAGNVDDIACYVISMSPKPIKWLPVPPGVHPGGTTTRLWIGKQDYLIHQIQFHQIPRTVEPSAMQSSNSPVTKAKSEETVSMQTHENISVNQKFPLTDFQQKTPENHSSITLHSAPPAKLPP